MSAFLTNVFEDPWTIREGGWLKRVRHMEAVPEDYGVAWMVPTHAVLICAPMPWHTLLGWAYHAYWWWRVGHGCSPTDALSRAWEAGRQYAEASADRRIAFHTAQHAMELQEARRRGRVAMLQDLHAEITGLKTDLSRGREPID